MYERLREILTKLDELQVDADQSGLSPTQEQEYATLLCEAQVKIKSDHPGLLEPAVTRNILPRSHNFQIYFKDGEVISAVGKDPDDATLHYVPKERRNMVEFCDPDILLRYKWMNDTRSWVLKTEKERTI